MVVLIALANDEEILMFTELLKEGFKGILLKPADDQEILQAIVAVANGNKYFCSSACEIINRNT